MAGVHRELSQNSSDSLHTLDAIEGELNEINQIVCKFTTLKQESASWNCSQYATEIHGALVQVEKLQARLDSIHTSELHVAKKEVQVRRKKLTIRCESLEEGLRLLKVSVEQVARIPSQVSNDLRDIHITNDLRSADAEPKVPHNAVVDFRCTSVTDSTVQLTWAKPRLESSGNELFVECYEVRARRDGDDGEWGIVVGGDSIKGDVTELSIPVVPEGEQVPGCALADTVLRPGVDYRFRIRAYLLHGWGPHTMLKGVTTRAPPPGAPQNIQLHSCGHSSCMIAWLAPSDGNPSASFVYELQFSPSAALAGGGEWLVASSTLQGTICKKLHLTPATMYSFRVRARHRAAANQPLPWGPWSTTLPITTLKLEDVIEAARRKARHNHYIRHDVIPAPPLGSEPPPTFERKPAPSSVLTIPTDALVHGDNRRVVCHLRRENLLEDSFVAMGTLPPREWARDMIVMFQGEDGLDYGALTRDWLKSLLEHLVRPGYGLFQQIASAGVSHPSRVGVAQTDYVVYYVLFGRALAKAFVSNTPVTVRLSTLVLKALLGLEHGALADLRHFDQDVHRSLTWMLENDVSVLEETFCTQFDVLGDRITMDLIPNGSQTPVTNANKHDFVNLKARAMMLSGIERQLTSICRGFHELVPMKSFNGFSVADLHVALSGVVEIKTHDWKKHTDVSDDFRNHPQVIQGFWEIVASMTNEQRSKLLYFATACASPPVGGFAHLTPRRFNIQTEPDLPPKSLPKAHSCFCTLVLPLDIADDFEEFRQKLNLAISECDGFGLL